jgi:hypothetical protein
MGDFEQILLQPAGMLGRILAMEREGVGHCRIQPSLLMVPKVPSPVAESLPAQ